MKEVIALNMMWADIVDKDMGKVIINKSTIESMFIDTEVDDNNKKHTYLVVRTFGRVYKMTPKEARAFIKREYSDHLKLR